MPKGCLQCGTTTAESIHILLVLRCNLFWHNASMKGWWWTYTRKHMCYRTNFLRVGTLSFGANHIDIDPLWRKPQILFIQCWTLQQAEMNRAIYYVQTNRSKILMLNIYIGTHMFHMFSLTIQLLQILW